MFIATGKIIGFRQYPSLQQGSVTIQVNDSDYKITIEGSKDLCMGMVRDYGIDGDIDIYVSASGKPESVGEASVPA